MKIIDVVFAFSLLGLLGCAGMEIPPEQKSANTFSQVSSRPYPEAHRIIAKQMLACHRTLGPLGVGLGIQASLDTGRRSGVVELTPIEFTGKPQRDAAALGCSVMVLNAPMGSVVITTGPMSRHVYQTHKAIAAWLEGDGDDDCDLFLDALYPTRPTSIERVS